MREKIAQIHNLKERLFCAETVSEKNALLDREPAIVQFLEKAPFLAKELNAANAATQYIVKLLIALGEGDQLFGGMTSDSNWQSALDLLVDKLEAVDRFYRPMGGLAGYTHMLLELIDSEKQDSQKQNFKSPPVFDLRRKTSSVRSAILAGIEALPFAVEIYPIGGAADRLNLFCQEKKLPLPAASLPFGGRSLLEGLVRDLQAREFLFYKLHGKQLSTPIVMMTSMEKDNHRLVTALCEKNGWFGRKREDFQFVVQPLVPVLTAEGSWAVHSPLSPQFKPGGHGAIWKLLSEEGILDRLLRADRKIALFRQINNPLAGVDDGLLAFVGTGIGQGKVFGFASCPRRVQTAEGINVLIEKKEKDFFSYAISNIEYTDFMRYGIEDRPAEPDSPYSAFPSNTNILFANLEKIAPLIKRNPFPGKVVNLRQQEGRLELSMQNLADAIVDRYALPLEEEGQRNLSTFLTYNERHKTISVTKRHYQEGGPLIETPEGAYWDLLRSYRELLVDHCGLSLPKLGSEERYLKEGPPFHFLLHPALGPLWSVVGQKISGGVIAAGAELQLDIVELSIQHLHIDGSLLIRAEEPLGHRDPEGKLIYSNRGGKCQLRDVTVSNRGIDRTKSSIFWQNQIARSESLEIILHGSGEFIAEGVTFKGGQRIEVPSGVRMRAYSENGKVTFSQEVLKEPSWWWEYQVGEKDEIILWQKDNGRDRANANCEGHSNQGAN